MKDHKYYVSHKNNNTDTTRDVKMVTEIQKDLQVSRSDDKFLYVKLPNMYYEGQRIYFSHIAIAHNQAHIIADLCWQEQIVSTKEGGISFCCLLCATKKLWQDPVKIVTVHHSRTFMQC